LGLWFLFSHSASKSTGKKELKKTVTMRNLSSDSGKTPFVKLWEANEKIFRDIECFVTAHYSHQRGIHLEDDWHKIAALGFFVAINKMRTIQFLMYPDHGQNYFMEAASLARNLWEIWLNLAWLNHQEENERQKRVKQFQCESIIQQDQINQAFSSLVSSGIQARDPWVSAEAERCRRQFPGRSWEMPKIVERMKDIALRDKRFKDSPSLYYSVVFKDLSHYVHFSWRTVSEINVREGMPVYPHYDLGFKCLDVGCGFFILITEIWNDVFKILPEDNFGKWIREWQKKQGETRGLQTPTT
jgi:hypothetical protein